MRDFRVTNRRLLLTATLWQSCTLITWILAMALKELASSYVKIRTDVKD